MMSRNIFYSYFQSAVYSYRVSRRNLHHAGKILALYRPRNRRV